MLALEVLELAFLLGIFAIETCFSQNGLIHQSIEVWINVGYHYGMKSGFQTILEFGLLLLVGVNISRSITGQLCKLPDILVHSHRTLLQIMELCSFHMDHSIRYVIFPEFLYKFFPGNGCWISCSFTEILPPFCGWSSQLVSCKGHSFSTNTVDHFKLLSDGSTPNVCLHWII